MTAWQPDTDVRKATAEDRRFLNHGTTVTDGLPPHLRLVHVWPSPLSFFLLLLDVFSCRPSTTLLAPSNYDTRIN